MLCTVRRDRECLQVKESHQGSVVVATKAALKAVSRIHLTLSVSGARGLLLISMGRSWSLGLRLCLRLTTVSLLSSFTLVTVFKTDGGNGVCSDNASLDSERTIVGVFIGAILVCVLVLVALLAVIAVMAGSTIL